MKKTLIALMLIANIGQAQAQYSCTMAQALTGCGPLFGGPPASFSQQPTVPLPVVNPGTPPNDVVKSVNMDKGGSNSAGVVLAVLVLAGILLYTASKPSTDFKINPRPLPEN